MAEYRVVVDGKTVWSDVTDEYEGFEHFPAEWVGRPANGEPPRTLIYGDVIVGVQVSEADEASAGGE